jgi:uncharacterized protein (UPF0210 family)
MRIRTITVGAREADLGRVATAAQRAKTQLEEAGYAVQTMRLALQQVSNTCADVSTVMQGAERLALDAGFDYVSVGPVEGKRLPDLAEAFSVTDAVFASATIVGPDAALRYDMIRAAAEAIHALSAVSPDGLANMRFAASAYVASGTPFFPASYFDSGEPWLAVGPEAAALAVGATRSVNNGHADKTGEEQRPSLAGFAALPRLTALIEEHDRAITGALLPLENEIHVRFAGCDWSLAPRADQECSIGAAIEAISGVPFGAWGTLAAVRGLTAAVRAARVRQLGFSGVMLPVLEDPTLAQRNAEGRYTLRDLLAFSAVCGTGLDTIPLPGGATADHIAHVLMEVASLASALRKPLTARLLPISAKAAGDETGFDTSDQSPFAGVICNTRVMGL